MSNRLNSDDVYWKIVHEAGMYDFACFTWECFEKKYPWSYIKDIIEKYYECNEHYYFVTYKDLTEVFPCVIIGDINQVEEWCKTVMSDNPQSVTDYKKGKKNSINHLKGQVMKMSKGKADIKIVNETLIKLLNE